jgi:phosphoribosylanthranilate isomerase
MSVLVKICGMTDERALDAAVAAGADALGLVFHAASPRNLVPRRAAALAARVPRGVLVVAVTLQPEQELVDRILEAFRPDVWQSDAADFKSVRLPPGIAIWPVLRGGGIAGPSVPGRVVFEAAESGQGRRANWREAALLARKTQLILGGGLDAGNVAAAIAAVSPFGIDVSSGVESAPGIKDPARIGAFVAAAHAEIAA